MSNYKEAHWANYEILIAGEHPRNRLLELVTKLRREVDAAQMKYADDQERIEKILVQLEEMINEQ